MEPDLITFKTFNDLGLANVLTELLDQHDIPHHMEENSASFNPAFISNELTKVYEVKIKGEDFTRVNELLKEQETDDINQVEKDYYLFDFTNEELLDILAKADEWSPFDYQLAHKILTERGVEISDKTLADLTKSRIEELKKPEPAQNSWVIIGYIFALAGGVIGLLWAGTYQPIKKRCLMAKWFTDIMKRTENMGNGYFTYLLWFLRSPLFTK
jgi:hypothetical protein